MPRIHFSLYCIGLIFSICFQNFAQTIPSGSPVFEEALRRKQLMGELDSTISFNIRPLQPNYLAELPVYGSYSFFEAGGPMGKINRRAPKKLFAILPFRNTLSYNSGRPYGWGNGLMIPNVGFQNYITAGVSAKYHFLNIQFQPEILWAQNLPFQGYPNHYPKEVNLARFFSWNNGDHPERFGDNPYSKMWWGQSRITLSLGAFETGISTGNIWWGPGQFNALTFSNNAQGFPHLTFNTSRPAKTFLGSFEGQIIMGRLEPSGFEPSQWVFLNEAYFKELSEDWRYLNGISVSYQPKWIPGLSLGLNRTFQQYSKDKTSSFGDWFPIFEVFTKTRLFEDGHTVDYDSRAQDQQVSIIGRYLFTQAKVELYFEYGKRDHALNWREFILNPEHARAYLIGFNKLFNLPDQPKLIQVRGEMTQQQESINRYIRYSGLGGGNSWHEHYQVRGFTNYGESLGVGIGSGGSNVQTLEVSLINKLNKFGVRLERLANHQDFYYRAFGQQQERQPWVDLSVGFLADYQWNRFMLSSNLTLIKGLNYQWQLRSPSTPEFPNGKNNFSIFAQAHLIYLLNRK